MNDPPGAEGFTTEPAGPRCDLCGRPTFDPDKRSVPWARAVRGGRQVLICPDDQRDRPDWMEGLAECVACGSTRLSIQLGSIVCRACGHTEPIEPPGA